MEEKTDIKAKTIKVDTGKGNTIINVNIKMYIFDHLKMYKFAYSSSGFMYSFNRYDLPVILITCA